MAKHIARFVCKRLGLVAAGVLGALLIAELGLRLIGIQYALPYRPDPHCGSRLQPNLSFRYIQEGNALVQTNSFGNRDAHREKSKPAGCFRIAILGDSYCEALQVAREATFWNKTEQHLNLSATGQPAYEVLNFGVSGYGTAQELLMLEHYVWQFEPDLILLAVLTGNDISDNSLALSGNPNRPYYCLDEQGILQLDDSFLQAPDFRKACLTWTQYKVAAINTSRVLQLVNHWKSRPLRASTRAEASIGESGLDSLVYQPAADAQWEQAWQVTEKLIGRFKSVCDSHHAALLVVTLTNALQVDPQPVRRTKAQEQMHVASLDYPDQRIADYCRSHQIETLTLVPHFREVAERDGIYFHGFANTSLGSGHWNEAGHDLAARLIADKFLSLSVADR